jgi:hypothetical protein
MPDISPAVGEVLTPAANGIITVFNLAHTPTDTAKVAMYIGANGLGGGVRVTNFAIVGKVVMFTAPPAAGDTPIADYPWDDGIPSAGDLTSLARVKLLLKETGSSADTLLSLLISTASADFKQATKRDILFASYSEVRDGNGTKAMEPRQYPVVAVTLVKVDETEIPAQPAYTSGQTPPYGWVVVDDRIEIESGWACGLPLPADSFVGETQPARFRRGNGNVTLEYTAGYVTVPADIDLAVAMWVAYRYKETDHIGQRSKSLDGGGTVAYLTDDAPASVQAVIARHSRMQI